MYSHKKPYKKVLMILLTMFLALFVLAALRRTYAAPVVTFTVNTTEDINDGTCDTAHCTLREAINAANLAAGADTIEFDLPPNATITLAGFQLAIISDNLTIDGRTTPNLTISGNTASRVFEVGSGAVVTLTTLTIARGTCPGCITGGGIKNSGTLIVSDSTFFKNLDRGIYNNGGTLIISATVFDTNFSGGINNNGGTLIINTTVFDGNLSGSGSAITNSGTLTVSNSLFKNNEAFVRGSPGGMGGAIFNRGTASINDSNFAANWAGGTLGYGLGGDVYNNLDGILTINNSTFTGIESFPTDYGGSIYNSGIVSITNSTISNNYANLNGGGIANYGTATVNNSTIFENSAVAFFGGGLYNEGMLALSNTIIAKSPAGGDCVNNGMISANINNLVEDGSCTPAFSGDPLLGPLMSNGGSAPTHAPLPGSPAIDSGDNASCAANDQRGVPRPLDGDENGTAVCDIGSVEVGEEFVLMPLVLKGE